MTITDTTPETGGFAALGLSDLTLRAITDLGYTTPTPIQEQTIARLLDGDDIIAQAQTGTGKTGAFALPIVERLDPILRAPQALILTPTRELAVQVAQAITSFSKYQPVSVAAMYGGQPISFQLRALRQGTHVVVGTPGRLLDHIQRGSLDLSNVRTVVLDEADEMLDMGFIEDIETILSATPSERQTALFSATMPGPIAELARKHMRNPQRISVKTTQMTAAAIEQSYYEVGQRDKFEVLARILEFERPASAIIFCRTKRDVDMLGERLVARGMPAETLHGDLSQVQRDRVMARFRSNQVVMLVATDVAARGLDIEHISHVINYDIPLDHESYIHRIGRTARAGRSGQAITLVNWREVRSLENIERLIKAKIERKKVPTLKDVAAKKQEAFRETLRTMIDSGEAQQYLALAEELSGEHDPALLAAAAFRLALGDLKTNATDELALREPQPRGEQRPMERPASRFNNDRRDRPAAEGFGDRRPAGPDRGPAQGMTRMYLDVGRMDGVRPADIVGAIANEAGISGRAIGAIELFDRSAIVELPSDRVERVVRALQRTSVRGVLMAPSLVGDQRR